MLRIYPFILDWIASLAPVIVAVRRHDAHLADQLRRSATAVALNVAEGSGATGGDKRRAYRIALREMREAVACLQIASRLQYVEPDVSLDRDRQSRIVGTLVRLARPWA